MEEENIYQENPWEEHYPPKPIVKERKTTIKQSIFSILIFIVAFYLFFDDLELVLILVVVIFIHEMGHLAAMKLFGYKDLQMLFIPLFGAIASGKKKTITQNQRAIILLGGPVPGIIIGGLLYLLHYLYGFDFLLKTANIFVLINAFNLVPITPLDGGRLVEVLFFGNSKFIQLIFSLISALLLVVVGLFTGSYLFIIFGALMLFGVYQSWFSYRLSRYLEALGFDLVKDYDDLDDKTYWEIRKEVISSRPTMKIDPDIKKYSSQESKLITQVQSVLRTKMVKDLGMAGVLFYIMVWVAFLVVIPVVCLMYYSLNVSGGVVV